MHNIVVCDARYQNLPTEMQFAKRLQPLQSNVFADMDTAKTKALAASLELIDLSLGSSDLAAQPHVIDAIAKSLDDPSTHGYLLFGATQSFRIAAATWYEQKFGISIDPETEVLPLIGSQEGTAHLPLAILNPGDYALLLDPGYPSHAGGVYLASGLIYPMPLRAENEFLPIFTDIPIDVLNKARMMVLSYPHNPTAATAPLSFFKEAVAFCQQHNIVLVHDFPYVDLIFSNQENKKLPTPNSSLPTPNSSLLTPNSSLPTPNSSLPTPNSSLPTPNSSLLTPNSSLLTPDPSTVAPSIFQADPEKSVSIEFFTLSKSYNMGGFRIGFAIGNAELIRALRQVKAAVDFNQYRGILNGAVAALTGPQTGVETAVATFKRRRDAFISALDNIGWHVPTPQATMYVWAKLPLPWHQNSVEFCTKLVQETGVAASPGAGFGKSGEGYVRFALVREPLILEIAVQRIAEFLR